jgi:hypothetical protein
LRELGRREWAEREVGGKLKKVQGREEDATRGLEY